MRTKDTTVAEYPLDLDDRAPEAASAHIATIVSLESDGPPLVDLGDGSPILPARLAVRATREQVETAIAERQATVVLFEGGDRARPLIVGFIETLEPLPQPAAPSSQEALPSVEVDVDGRRLRVTAQDEIVLQCGSASITLR